MMTYKFLILLIVAMMLNLTGCTKKYDARLIDKSSLELNRNIIEMDLTTGERIKSEEIEVLQPLKQGQNNEPDFN
ncbi:MULTISPECIES: hypothetical protein [unclassified Pseudoalteromonas]|uniref:hypothetical protein n=1 Tax=unclassified Pseudoalteromonas TaxID=194690 RepID=UPI001F3D26E2|nr:MULTISPECIES: hypothetical protein [unclassified Pseudoalteromonas]MCF2829710.1 hypothetical protein [Pseudoalteromonas sp. OF5H-5]MCF2832606.1 hypothetical protein [Pseudoalteromonas sp. DL2-H6]MCF2927600.1 hypothetical protein [Pseudoalteromonas sp. DL2-H1]